MKIMNRILILSMFVFLAGFTANAQNVGYVDVHGIFESLPEYKEANSELEVMAEQFKKKGEAKIQELQTKYMELQQKQANGELAPNEIQRQSNELKEQENELRKFDQESQQKMSEKSTELLTPIQDKLFKAIDEVAKENGYLYIFDIGQGMILYADPSSDVTELVRAKVMAE